MKTKGGGHFYCNVLKLMAWSGVTRWGGRMLRYPHLDHWSLLQCHYEASCFLLVITSIIRVGCCHYLLLDFYELTEHTCQMHPLSTVWTGQRWIVSYLPISLNHKHLICPCSFQIIWCNRAMGLDTYMEVECVCYEVVWPFLLLHAFVSVDACLYGCWYLVVLLKVPFWLDSIFKSLLQPSDLHPHAVDVILLQDND